MENGVRNYIRSVACGVLLSFAPFFLQAQKHKESTKDEKSLLLKDIKIFEDSIAGMREAILGIMNDPGYIRWKTQFDLNRKLLTHTLPDLRSNFPQNYSLLRYQRDSTSSSAAIEQAESELLSYREALAYFQGAIQILEREILEYRNILLEEFSSREDMRKNKNKQSPSRIFRRFKKYASE